MASTTPADGAASTINVGGSRVRTHRRLPPHGSALSNSAARSTTPVAGVDGITTAGEIAAIRWLQSCSSKRRIGTGMAKSGAVDVSRTSPSTITQKGAGDGVGLVVDSLATESHESNTTPYWNDRTTAVLSAWLPIQTALTMTTGVVLGATHADAVCEASSVGNATLPWGGWRNT